MLLLVKESLHCHASTFSITIIILCCDYPWSLGAGPSPTNPCPDSRLPGPAQTPPQPTCITTDIRTQKHSDTHTHTHTLFQPLKDNYTHPTIADAYKLEVLPVALAYCGVAFTAWGYFKQQYLSSDDAAAPDAAGAVASIGVGGAHSAAPAPAAHNRVVNAPPRRKDLQALLKSACRSLKRAQARVRILTARLKSKKEDLDTILAAGKTGRKKTNFRCEVA